ncbi:MAG: GNAT family N-acetyltransferase [Ramlibacter sp.]|nr:GNAT family N-acetyltransferase [Ramlibacter sp.]
MIIRDATSSDFGAILRLNAESEHFLSPLAEQKLQRLHAGAAYHRVACVDGAVAAFLLAFREGAAYDSVNYLWFAARYPQFLYIDRVVVDVAFQSRRLGTLLYEDLFAFARSTGAPRVTCEFDIQPPNPVSARFHGKFGFTEVGRQDVAYAAKAVSLQEAVL